MQGALVLVPASEGSQNSKTPPRSSIARWLKQAIAASGRNSDFLAHSVGGASSLSVAAMIGLTIREVMD